jgi:FkbM family methyltransferase
MEARLVEDLDPIPDGSLIWDVGAYEGRWADVIRQLYPKAKLRMFEPVPAYAERLAASWLPGVGVSLSPYGLSDRVEFPLIKVAGDRSSTYDIPQEGQGKVEIELRDVSKELGETRLDVMKINVEGAEYPILERLLSTGQISQVRTFLIQFHTFIPNFGERYLAIKKGMLNTHYLTWRQPFVWERWDRA